MAVANTEPVAGALVGGQGRSPDARSAKLLWLALGVVVALAVILHVVSLGDETLGRPDIRTYSATYIADNIDRRKIVPTVASVHTLAGTLRWWHGNWCGWGGYWRPLTSTGFWLEYRMFGADRQDLWQVALIVSHLAFTSVFGLFALRVTGRVGVAMLAVFLFAGCRVVFPALESHVPFGVYGLMFVPADVAIANWIDQPEPWFGLCALGSLLFAMESRWGWSLLLAALSVSFKEPGWYTFPMVAVFLAMTGRIKQVPPWVYAAGVLTALCLIGLRVASGPDVLYHHMGYSNRNWLTRYFFDICGWLVAMLSSISRAQALVGVVIALTVRFAPGGFYGKLGTALASVGAILALDRLQTGNDLITEAMMTFDPSCDLWIVVFSGVYALTLSYALFSSEARRQTLVLYPLIAISAVSQMVDLQNKSDHMDYVPHALQSLVVAIVIAAAWRRYLAARRARSLSPLPLEPARA